MTGVDEYAAYNHDRSVIAPAFAAFCERVPEAARVLDLDCGPGWETQALHTRGSEAIGRDLSAAFCSYARREYPADDHIGGDMNFLPFAANSFSGVWACVSMLHIAREDMPAVLSEVARILIPRRRSRRTPFRSATPSVSSPRKAAPGHQLFYAYRTPEEWRVAIESAGFAIDDLVTEVSEEEQTHLNGAPEAGPLPSRTAATPRNHGP